MVTLLLLPLLVHAPQEATAEAFLDKVRAAVGPKQSFQRDMLFTGDGSRMGLNGPYTFRLSSDGKYVYEQRSDLGQKVGFDGKQVWEADRTGATTVLSFDEEDRVRSFNAVLTGAWLDKGALASATLVPSATNTVAIKMKGSEIEQLIQVDPVTNLPSRIATESGAGTGEVLFSNWRPTPLRKMPFEIAIQEGGVLGRISLTKLESVEPNPSAFAKPNWIAKDVKFDLSAPAQLETKRLPSGHIMVHPRVNGKDIGWFILDSGAGAMCIDKTAADGLGLKKLGEVPAVGVGGVVKVPFRPAAEFTLGQGTFTNLMMLELDLAQISKAVGVPLGGIVGHDVFRRCVIEMDVKAPRVNLTDPSQYQLKSGKWQEVRFDGGNIGVEAGFEGGRKGWFRLDTGAGSALTFHAPFVERYKLLEGRELTTTRDGGVGGSQESKRGKIAYFELAGHRFENPTVGFSISKVGAFNHNWLVGNIGQGFMDPFVMVFDYPNSRMAFVPRT